MSTISRAIETTETLESAAAAEAAFYDAIRRADIDAVMQLWAEDDTAVCIHPGTPRLIGRASIRASWESIFERGGVHIRPVQVHASGNATTAIHNVIEEVQRASSQRSDIHILATNVYLRTEHGWRLVSHHASVVPGEAPVDQSVSALLH